MSETQIEFRDLADRPEQLQQQIRHVLESADVIVAEDESALSRIVVYGRQRLKEAEAQRRVSELTIVVAVIDGREHAQHLERLCDLVKALKGRNDCPTSERILYREKLLRLLEEMKSTIRAVKLAVEKSGGDSWATEQAPRRIEQLGEAHARISDLLNEDQA